MAKYSGYHERMHRKQMDGNIDATGKEGQGRGMGAGQCCCCIGALWQDCLCDTLQAVECSALFCLACT